MKMKSDVITAIDELKGMPQIFENETSEGTVLFNVLNGFSVHLAEKSSGLFKSKVHGYGLNICYENDSGDRLCSSHGVFISGAQIDKFMQLMRKQSGLYQRQLTQ